MADNKEFEVWHVPLADREYVFVMQTKYNRVERVIPEYPQEDIVKRQGYRTVAQQVKELTSAGLALDAHRRFQYQFAPGTEPPANARVANPAYWDEQDQKAFLADIQELVNDRLAELQAKREGESAENGAEEGKTEAPEEPKV